MPLRKGDYNIWGVSAPFQVTNAVDFDGTTCRVIVQASKDKMLYRLELPFPQGP